MIRHATADDTKRLLEMGRRFVAETPYHEFLTLDAARLAAMIHTVLDSPNGAVFVSGSDVITGMLALVVSEHPYSGEKVATEFVWWVDPEARGDGLRLLRAAEQWATERGAAAMLMVAPSARVGVLYERLGYRAVETTYQRRL